MSNFVKFFVVLVFSIVSLVVLPGCYSVTQEGGQGNLIWPLLCSCIIITNNTPYNLEISCSGGVLVRNLKPGQTATLDAPLGSTGEILYLAKASDLDSNYIGVATFRLYVSGRGRTDTAWVVNSWEIQVPRRANN